MSCLGRGKRKGGRVWFATCAPSFRRITIRSDEESVFCSTVLLRGGFISADFFPSPDNSKIPTHSHHRVMQAASVMVGFTLPPSLFPLLSING